MVFRWKRGNNQKNRKSVINADLTPFESLDPERLFCRYDKDSSGKILFGEFKDMLVDLGIQITEAKAMKYFAVCDLDKSGFIDFDEFTVALYICDPHSGNSIGFSPHGLLSPQDAFEMFDTNGDGQLDEDEFFRVLEYLGLEVSDEIQEEMFKRYDKDNSGFIEYPEFKKVWVRVSDTEKELLDRGISIPNLSTKFQRVRLLERTIDREEEFERLALQEAELWREWQISITKKKRLIFNAEKRSNKELTKALDIAGQLYVFGKGTFGQFCGPSRSEMKIDNLYQQEGFDRMQKLWTERATKMGANPNTVGLWGRMPIDIAISDNVMFALTDSGEIFAWGGTSTFWHEIEPDSYWQLHWRSDTTPRSKKLLTTEHLTAPRTDGTCTKSDSTNQELAKLVRIMHYYEVWESLPDDKNPLSFIHSSILPKVHFDQIQLSIQIRGKMGSGLTKLQMIDILHDDLRFERKTYGELFQRKIREHEIEIMSLNKRNKTNMAKSLFLEIHDAWKPLRSMQLEEEKQNSVELKEKERSELRRLDDIFENWLHKASSKEESRGTSLKLQSPSINGFTERGPLLNDSRGYGHKIFAGANHVGLIDKSGALYTWGVGNSGRLGLNESNESKVIHDADHPTEVRSLKGYTVISGSCGHSHTAVLCSNGECFVWGSAHDGKLGLDHRSKEQEYFLSCPVRLHIHRCQKVETISCGSSHTAAIGDDGKLYVWGCGDGGRIGTNGITHHLPHLVEYLVHENFTDVSCGCFQTLAITAINEANEENKFKVTGGKLYAAGASCCLGEFYPYFDCYDSIASTPINKISAGYMHQMIVAYNGDLLGWGNNQEGCCGHHSMLSFLPEPTKVPRWFDMPSNLALGKPCNQSSIYGGLDAQIAVNGNKNGHQFIHTQMDPQPYWDLDLGVDECEISRVHLWNRTDTPTDRTTDLDKYTKRLFPCWIMISRIKFPTGLGGECLVQSLSNSIAAIRLTENKRRSIWQLPSKTLGRFIRVQLEGYNVLHFSEVEVYGYYPGHESFGRVHEVQAGKNVSAIVIRASNDPRDKDICLRHAIAADSYNRRILRSLLYFKDNSIPSKISEIHKSKCILCPEQACCSVCELKTAYLTELSNSGLQDMGLQNDILAIRSFLLDPKRSRYFNDDSDQTKSNQIS